MSNYKGAVRPSWLPAVSVALTGAELSGPVTGPDPVALVAALAAAGWDRERLLQFRAGRQAEQLVWPVPLAPEVVRELGSAQLLAVIAAVNDRLGLNRPGHGSGGPPIVARLGQPAQQHPPRLARLEDRPPHW